MFAIKYNKLASWSTTIGYGNGYALHFGVRGNDQANSFPFGQGWGAGPVAPNFYNDWSVAEQDDARRPASVFKTEDMPTNYETQEQDYNQNYSHNHQYTQPHPAWSKLSHQANQLKSTDYSSY